ncbi:MULTISPECIES: hypothetical protein [Bradyrhizobium]|uniref:hypothetical protein n=1 Tax=Bradyrhizobium TaxID=374 RepID=UPI002306D4B2|nr:MULTISPECIES: hypothetical protein [unclassified Bradyrhizobium]MDA9452238.1 hypothetical protein [Bradyrhizobium sp. CCBAU 21360]
MAIPARNQLRIHKSAWDVFRWPVLVSVVCGAGLGVALVGDGFWDALSWLGLSLPVVLAIVCWRRAGRPR